ncbi:flagellar hook-basal body complex protein [Clostridium brassicae]|uniref:Flagellar hook-basal body complex protein n=1 Tax=Clostridium brassicae TaxID=2999072 RepID=A0ABT4DBE0_9CLOT|nr:flagellar hook-basal body complex protein [Clostridium brassicae]MCY6959622.1 flagellar hook-basal body complex protein [Clostridium brassicae]
MIRSIYTAVSGLITQEAKQDTISNNLANANTIGYKKDNLIAKKFEDVMIQNYDKIQNGKNVRNEIGTLSMGSKIDGTYTLFQQGVITGTDKDTDFAINGRGFFTVTRGTTGNRLYTRDGQFHIDNSGYLANSSGDRVLGRNIRNGNVEPIYVGNGEMKSDDGGNININGAPSYKLYIADFQDYSSLKKMEDNLFQGENPTEINARVFQNSLEKSNVNIMAEMSDMMMTMRSFESSQKVIQSLDETLGKTVNEVGRV